MSYVLNSYLLTYLHSDGINASYHCVLRQYKLRAATPCLRRMDSTSQRLLRGESIFLKQKMLGWEWAQY